MTSDESGPGRVAVVGTGLIGTSIAMAAIRAGDAVAGYDRDRAALDQAAERSGLATASDVETCVGGARFAFVCTPPESIADIVWKCLRADAAVVVTDVGSVKSKVVREVEGEGEGEASSRSRFVGGHPMGGSERTGPEGASASLIEGAAWVLTPGQWTDPAATEMLEVYLSSIGAHPIQMTAERHDRLVALVSHLPQVVSSSLMGLVTGDVVGDPRALALAASGFRDVTRLAGSDPELWTDILLSNQEALLEAIDLFIDELQRFRTDVAEAKSAEIARVLEEGRAARAELGAKPRVRAGMALLQIPVPDRPGVLAEMTVALGHGDVNIEDLQIVHSPWGPAGVVHLTVLAERADAAIDILRAGRFEPVRVA